MEEKERNLPCEEVQDSDERILADTELMGETQEETKKEPSAEEIEAMKKMENIFKSVSQNKPEPEKVQEEAQEQSAEVDNPTPEEEKSNTAEIELMTVTKPTSREKDALERRMQEEKKAKNNKRVRKTILAILVVMLVVIGGSFYADYMPGGASGEVVITVPQGAGTAQIAEILKKDHLIGSEFFYRIMSKIRGIDGKYNFGKFKLERNSGYEGIFKSLTQAGANVGAVKVTIPEGYEIYKIADTLEAKGLINKDKFYYLIDYGDFDYEFVKNIPERNNRLEGYLFPDTYEFAPGDEYGIINEMLGRFNKAYQKYENRMTEIDMTMDEVITLASIIEREALGDEDRKLVSSVFHNRLKSTQYPYLQSCATVQYVLRERKPILTVEDTRIDSPYNTYINKGLPIGPIASPGEEAIEAALYPAESDYLFFVLGNDNKHHFSKTFGEHKQNKNS